MPNWLTRVLAAAVLVPLLVLVLVRAEPVWFAVLVAAATLLAMHEFYALASRRGLAPVAPLGYAAAAAYQLTLAPGLPAFPLDGLVGQFSVLLAGFTLALLLSWFARGPRPGNLIDGAVTAFGALYLGVLLGFLVQLRTLPDGVAWAGSLLLTTWLYDTFAYVWGTTVGRRKMWPAVSPKKTWEGFWGGLVTTTVVLIALRALPDSLAGMPRLVPDAAVPGFLGWAVPLLCVAAQAGDLAESMLKRAAKIKDSGGLIPGHGGLLDKVDSFTFTAPVWYVAALFAERLVSF